ncbi:molybdenum cofactor biosynthesis protein MoaE [Acidocella aquatica]|uniref:Molybdopterin synthase catalytic subunit n=1 Tax=Acidocella aquatica TaxID=1922313 RepID=A0ABQ6A925_9PROT|nr:molybdenum cofactor biosynthesis protein MoaE [Acidocella aquatica]GLR68719.1 molybdenum cofactor biosynthesis protein MoaE [Acidocella aquatica]
MPRILVQAADFNPGAELAHLGGSGTGGIASFTGIVRAGDGPGPRVSALTLEHYPGMTEAALAKIAARAQARWALTGCTIIHRIGRLLPGENIVFVAAASAHRGDALQAVAFLIDYLKTGAPFWKAEELETGERRWVAARAADETAAAAWHE